MIYLSPVLETEDQCFDLKLIITIVLWILISNLDDGLINLVYIRFVIDRVATALK